jgi:site-specific DNA-cytosine methylase
MPAKRTPARRTTPARRRKPAARKHPARRVKIPRGGPLPARIGTWFVLRVVTPAVTTRSDVIRSRKDAAILRATHEGCSTCGGNGQIFTKGKNGEFTGSKPCPAKPTKTKVSRTQVWKASRFGADKNTGLVGCSCPCGWKHKPRYRDAKEATKALRAHEKQKHGGKSVGGTWYAQATEAAIQTVPEKKTAARKTAAKKTTARRASTTKTPDVSQYEVRRQPAPYEPNNPAQEHRRKPVSSNPDQKNQHSGLTDYEWVTQDQDRKTMPGECPRCQGTSMVYALNADAKTDYDRQIVIPCPNKACSGGRIAA